MVGLPSRCIGTLSVDDRESHSRSWPMSALQIARVSVGKGRARDLPRHLLADRGFFDDGEDVLLGVVGKPRKRGGTRQMVGVARQSFPQSLLAHMSGGADQARVLMGFGGGRFDGSTIH